MRIIKGWLVGILVVAGLAGIAWGAPPTPLRDYAYQINVQGRLTDKLSGEEVRDLYYDFVFTLQRSRIGALPAWADAGWTERKRVRVANGVFNAILGTTTPFPMLDPAYDYRLSINFDGEDMSPPQTLVSVPLAITARNLRGGVVSAKNADGTAVLASSTSGMALIARTTTGSFALVGGYGEGMFGTEVGILGDKRGYGVTGISSNVGGYFTGKNSSGDIASPKGALYVKNITSAANGDAITGIGKGGGEGVEGYSDSGYGVQGESESGYEVFGKTAAAAKAGVYGENTSDSDGAVGIYAKVGSRDSGTRNYAVKGEQFVAGRLRSEGELAGKDEQYFGVKGKYHINNNRGFLGTAYHGVYGRSDNVSSDALYGYNTADGPALRISQGKIEIDRTAHGVNSRASGVVTLRDESTSIWVNNSYVTNNSIILLTIQDGVGVNSALITNRVAGVRFRVDIDRVLPIVAGDIKVGYLIIN